MGRITSICLVMQKNNDWLAGSEYVKNIACALGSLPADVRSCFKLSLICNKRFVLAYDNIYPLLDSVYFEEEDLEPLTMANRIKWKAKRIFQRGKDFRLESFLRKRDIDFVYPVNQVIGRDGCRSAAWIPDFQHKYFPQFFTEKEIVERDMAFSAVAQRALNVVLSSNVAKSDFIKFFPAESEKARVLPFRSFPDPGWYALDPLDIQLKYHLPDSFFLVSNQFWQHKNHIAVFKALKVLKERDVYPSVVCTGHVYDYRKPFYFESLLQTIHKLDISRQVYVLGLIPRLDQIQLMRRSVAVIQPSLFEGWSTLVEDTRALGKSIILSDIPVHKEQSPPNCIYFNPDSIEELADAMRTWWIDLGSGPHLDLEESARMKIWKEVDTFGRQFLEIALNA